MPLRCAILDDYQNVALKFADWSSLKDRIDITVFDKPFASQDEAVRALQDFEIVCAMRERTPFPREVLTALPKLKLLLTSGMRNASFDLEAAKERGVTVCGTGGVGNATASLAIGLMLELTRKIGFENARMHDGELWQTTMGQDVEGMTLGVVGLGKLGTKVAAIAKALGMNVIAWSQNLTPEACAAAGVSYATKDELFATADIVTIHTILSKRTRGLITRDDLAQMKPTSYLVNTARGPIVDEAALLDTLQRRKIAGAGLDTFSQEPLPLDHLLRKLDNVVLTPHLGYVTENNYRRYYGDMVEDIAAWLSGAPVRVMT
ncbi:D-2-hydroxyacid dehydrogenase family protein [Afipia sp. DC4300-2b1]|uniref:D-2-hydroxyacid dehydrogenase family protein n=1 Tax=Afipia sp. DC4300-2b1 TaxID=2804672 RepID=UPI003CF04A0F